MQAIPLIAAVGSAVLGAYSASQQASQQKAALKYQAQVDRNNAQIAEWNAQAIARKGERDIIAQQRKNAAIMGSQRAGFASRGIDLSEGSPLNILSDTAYFGDQDVLTIADNTAKDVWAARLDKQNYSNSAQLKQSQARSISPVTAGATSLLTGAGQVASTWYRDKGAISAGFR